MDQIHDWVQFLCVLGAALVITVGCVIAYRRENS